MKLNSERELARQKISADTITTNRGDIKAIDAKEDNVVDDDEETKNAAKSTEEPKPSEPKNEVVVNLEAPTPTATDKAIQKKA